METFLVALAAFAVAMLLLSAGTLLGRRRLRGSCGGLAGRHDGEGGGCVCGNSPTDCGARGNKRLTIEPCARPGPERSEPPSSSALDGPERGAP